MKNLIALFVMSALFAFTTVATQAAECQGKGQHAKNPELRTGNVATDPVCGMEVKTVGAKYVYEYKGKKYYFCTKEYMDEFKKNPQGYLNKQK